MTYPSFTHSNHARDVDETGGTDANLGTRDDEVAVGTVDQESVDASEGGDTAAARTEDVVTEPTAEHPMVQQNVLGFYHGAPNLGADPVGRRDDVETEAYAAEADADAQHEAGEQDEDDDGEDLDVDAVATSPEVVDDTTDEEVDPDALDDETDAQASPEVVDTAGAMTDDEVADRATTDDQAPDDDVTDRVMADDDAIDRQLANDDVADAQDADETDAEAAAAAEAEAEATADAEDAAEAQAEADAEVESDAEATTAATAEAEANAEADAEAAADAEEAGAEAAEAKAVEPEPEPEAVDAEAVDAEAVDAEAVDEAQDGAVADVLNGEDSDVSDGVLSEHDAAEHDVVENGDVSATPAEAAADQPDVVVGEVVDEDNCAGPVAHEGVLNGEPVVDGLLVEQVTPSGNMRPGDAPLADAVGSLVDVDALRERWQQAQLGFIDDPHGSATAARAIAAETLEGHIAALRTRAAELDSWQDEATPDTEILRAAMRGYRDLISSFVVG